MADYARRVSIAIDSLCSVTALHQWHDHYFLTVQESPIASYGSAKARKHNGMPFSSTNSNTVTSSAAYPGNVTHLPFCIFLAVLPIAVNTAVLTSSDSACPGEADGTFGVGVGPQLTGPNMRTSATTSAIMNIAILKNLFSVLLCILPSLFLVGAERFELSSLVSKTSASAVALRARNGTTSVPFCTQDKCKPVGFPTRRTHARSCRSMPFGAFPSRITPQPTYLKRLTLLERRSSDLRSSAEKKEQRRTFDSADAVVYYQGGYRDLNPKHRLGRPLRYHYAIAALETVILSEYYA